MPSASDQVVVSSRISVPDGEPETDPSSAASTRRVAAAGREGSRGPAAARDSAQRYAYTGNMPKSSCKWATLRLLGVLELAAPTIDDGDRMRDARALEQILGQLPTNELFGLCQIEMNQPVRGCDVRTGLDLHPQEARLVLAEIGARMGLAGTRDGVIDVMGAVEAAAALGVKQSNLRTVAGLPAPIAKLSATPLWGGAAVRELAARRHAATGPRQNEEA